MSLRAREVSERTWVRIPLEKHETWDGEVISRDKHAILDRDFSGPSILITETKSNLKIASEGLP